MPVSIGQARTASNVSTSFTGEPVAPAGIESAYEQVVQNQFDAIASKGQRVLVVMDGIDEALQGSFPPGIFPKRPQTLRILLWARWQVEDTDSQGWLKRLEWDRKAHSAPITLPERQGRHVVHFRQPRRERDQEPRRIHRRSQQRTAGATNRKMAEVSPVDLGLLARQPAQAQIGLCRPAWPMTGNKVAEATCSAMKASTSARGVSWTSRRRPGKRIPASRPGWRA
jgi:hypothetical protein